jgi:hypothetical protein
MHDEDRIQIQINIINNLKKGMACAFSEEVTNFYPLHIHDLCIQLYLFLQVSTMCNIKIELEKTTVQRKL